MLATAYLPSEEIHHMSKYETLTAYLSKRGQKSIPMTFEEIERILGTKLPPSAFKHLTWWSNNPTNNPRTYAWLNAGYKTMNIDIEGRKLVFRKPAPNKPLLESGGKQPAHGKPCYKTESSFFLHVSGSLKGTVTVSPGVDLTAPVSGQWSNAE